MDVKNIVYQGTVKSHTEKKLDSERLSLLTFMVTVLFILSFQISLHSLGVIYWAQQGCWLSQDNKYYSSAILPLYAVLQQTLVSILWFEQHFIFSVIS